MSTVIPDSKFTSEEDTLTAIHRELNPIRADLKYTHDQPQYVRPADLRAQSPKSSGMSVKALTTLTRLHTLLLSVKDLTFSSNPLMPLASLMPSASEVPSNSEASAGLTSTLSTFNPEIASKIIKHCLGDEVELLIAEESKTSMLSLNVQEASRASIPWLKQIDKIMSHGKDSPDNSLKIPRLTKPLILIFPYQSSISSKKGDANGQVMDDVATSDAKQSGERLALQAGDLQWITCVVLPKNYTALNGSKTGNEQGEMLFYLDPIANQNPQDVPQRFLIFYKMITKGVSFKERISGQTEFRSVVIHPFPRCLFYNGSRAQQHSSSDSFSWAIYNAMMVVLTGNTNFIPAYEHLPKDKVNLALNRLLSTILTPPGPQIPPYTLRNITTLLVAHRITQGLQKHLSKDATQKYEIYFYPVQGLEPDMLLKDSILYFLSRNEIINRRVCFLLQGTGSTPLALIVQLGQVNSRVVDELQRQLNARNITSQQSELKAFGEILNWTDGVNLFKQIYGHIQAIFLGSSAVAGLVQQLKTPFEKAYAGKIHLGFKGVASVNPTVQLTDDILQMLRCGETRSVPSVQLFSEHREICARDLLASLQGSLQPNQYQSILGIIEILLKYLTLEQQRKQYPSPENTIDALEGLLELDLQVKKSIYSKRLNSHEMQQGLRQLELSSITDMLALLDKPSLLSQQLEQACTRSAQNIQAWEVALQKRIQEQSTWLPYLWNKSKRATKFMYQNSLIPLGAEGIHWMGQIVANLIPNPVKTEAKAFAQTSAKWAVLCFTLSPRLANKSHHVMGKLLNPKNISLALKTSGAALGLMATGAQGIYAATRMLGITTITQYCYNQLNLPRVIKEKATLIPALLQLSPIHLFRFFNIVAAFFETLYFRNPQLFVHVLSGMTGSLITTNLAQKYLDALKPKSGQRPNEEQVYILFLLSIAGYDIGRGIGEYSYQSFLSVYNRYQLRARVIEQLQTLALEQQVQDFTIEPEGIENTNPANPLLWLKISAEKVKWTWRGREGIYHHADCDIGSSYVDINLGEKQNIISCVFVSSSPRLVGPS